MWGKALSPRHAIVAVVKHGHLMTVISYQLEVMKPTIFFLESPFSSLSDTFVRL
jgi:hypothetical protein